MTTTDTRQRDHAAIHARRQDLAQQKALFGEVPKGLSVGADSLRTDGPLDEATWERIIGSLIGRAASDNWWLGDAYRQAVEDLGEAAAIGILYQHGAETRANRLLAVAVSFPPERRVSGLSWSHHDVVHQLPPDAADRWLVAAKAQGWHYRDMAKAILADATAGQGRLDPPARPDLPQPPVSRLRSILDEDPDATVVWEPSTGTMRAVPHFVLEATAQELAAAEVLIQQWRTEQAG